MIKYYVYIVRCQDNTFYTGVAKDLEQRINEHNFSKLGAKYTRGRRPVTLVYAKRFKNRSVAQIEEARIKKLNRIQKLELIAECYKST